MKPWAKFAILGSTYARALGNAAQRSGAQLPQNVLGAIASRPNTQIASGLAQRARGGVAGALAPTPQQQQLQTTAAKIPNSEEGLPGAPGKGYERARMMFNMHFGDRTQMVMRPGARPPMQADVPTGVLARPKVAGLPTAAGIAAPLALGGALLAGKPGIKANVRALAEGGSTKERDVAGELPEPAIGQANAIRDALSARGMDPMSVRMGIDAPPGSGKTTLARALAQQAGMKHYSLDWEPGNAWKSTIGLGRNVEKMPHTPHAGEVLEHYMLGRTYDPELFDAMVHIHRDPNVLRQQLQHRGHGAYIGDMMDLDKSLNVADLGFNTLGGDVIDLGNGVQMKLRPQDGWGNVLDQRLMAGGIDPTGMTRHEKLLSLHSGKKETGAGWTPYVKSPFSGAETAAIGASIPLGVMAARALRNRPR